MKMKATTILIAAAIATGANAAPYCIDLGGGMESCSDGGSSWTNTDLGGGVVISNGRDSRGESWNGTSIDLGGGISSVSGNDSAGTTWNGTSINVGGGIRSINATDSNGRSYNINCFQRSCQ